MTTYTQEVLAAGGFELAWSSKLGEDISGLVALDGSAWKDMRAALQRVRAGTCRSDEWDAPLDRKNVDLGEIKRRGNGGLYRLYVRADRMRPNVLVLLHFTWKPYGEDGLAMQDGHIDEAFNRFMDMQEKP